MRILAVDVPEPYHLTERRVKCAVGITGKLLDLCKITGKLIGNLCRLTCSCIQLRNLGILVCPGQKAALNLTKLVSNLRV